MSLTPSYSPRRSTFITAVAWIFIALAGFATLMSALQNVMINVMLSGVDLKAEISKASDASAPAFAVFMASNARLIFFAFFILSAATLVAAIGLLKRRNWARCLFIALMAFGILWNLGSIPLSMLFMSAMPTVPANAPPGFGDQFEIMSKVMVGVSIVFGICFAVLFGWIVKRLLSEDVRREFDAA